MFRCLSLTVASVAIQFVDPGELAIIRSLPLSVGQLDLITRCLRWALPVLATSALNSLLSRWALDRWSWKKDKSWQNWGNEIAVVTGGSAGIGAAVVQKLLSHDVKVAVLDIAPLGASFSNSEKERIYHYHCDMTSTKDIHSAAEAIRSDLGHPSILINNAGIGNGATILELPESDLRRLFDINLLSHWTTVQEFLPDMLAKKKGHIMGVASLASFVSLAGAADYSCTKAALVAFHEALTQELKHRHKCPEIKTSLVHPGWTRSAITAHPAIASGLKRIRTRLLEPDYVAEAMVQQILTAQNGQIILGPGIVSKLRALPIWLQEIIRDTQANVVSGRGSTS